MRPVLLLLYFAVACACQAVERWVYVSDNLLVDKRVEELEELLQRASKAGYTHILLADSKFCRLGEMPDRYFKNVGRIKQAATTANISIIPAVFPVGYSNDLLYQDPNLAEGPPVKDALFVVQGSVAKLESDPPVTLRGGDMADLKLWSMRDDNMVAYAGAVRVTDPKGANARIAQKVKLAPFRQYHISVRVKTADFAGTPEVKAIANGRVLNFDNLGARRTQDWHTHHVIFNSLTNHEAMIYLGAWGANTGSLWWDDVVIEEVGLVNLIRREGAPFHARVENGRELVEGTDFEPVRDPNMGTKPYAGCYDVYHEPPVIHTKGLADGTRLRVSYHHVATIYDGQAMMDIAEPRALELLRDQARRVHELFHAGGYMMSHDEIRVLGWSEAFQRRGMTPGQLIAENTRECVKILRALKPDVRIYTWSDMFDPAHNAVPGPYYLVNGPLTGSWEGLDPSVIIMQWHGDTLAGRQASLKFFADCGHPQILAAYYDAGPKQVRDWLDAAQGVKGVNGVMYTTWQSNYRDLEAIGRLLRDAGW
ncbi:MAG TPA: hypothetical protein VHH73_01990 [Verrucomicrobiae bacterium]|nr:hypothetical protein [Verrucomicrobiae bacterium]